MFEKDSIAIACPECGHTEFEDLGNEQEEDKLLMCCNCKLEILSSDLEYEGMQQVQKGIVMETKEGVVKLFKNLINGEKLTS